MIEVYHLSRNNGKIAVFYEHMYELDYLSSYYAGRERPHFPPPAIPVSAIIFSEQVILVTRDYSMDVHDVLGFVELEIYYKDDWPC